MRHTLVLRTMTLAMALVLSMTVIAGCAKPASESNDPAVAGTPSMPNGLLLALAVLGKDDAGKPLPQPARLGILVPYGDEWRYRTIDDPDSKAFHKGMVFRPAGGAPGILTAGGTRAIVKLWRKGATAEVLWESDFGGNPNRIRMRDLEVADLYGDGTPVIAVATHDQGVVAVIRPTAEGGWQATELDRQENTIVHEVEIGDLDGDGVPEIYATPSLPNKLDGTPQPGSVVRYVPAKAEGRVTVADLGDRHAKEILVDDVDGDGRDELYVSVEAVAGGRVRILRYDAGTDPTAGVEIASFDDKLCRFLTAGDIDGDGSKEMVVAAKTSGLWLLRPGDAGSGWSVESIDRGSGGFEHAALLTDLDGDGVDELYVANDDGDEVNCYRWQDTVASKTTIFRYTDGLSGFTWNIMPVPVELIPDA